MDPGCPLKFLSPNPVSDSLHATLRTHTCPYCRRSRYAPIKSGLSSLMLISDDPTPIHLFDFSILSCIGQFIIFISDCLHPKLLIHTLLSFVVCNVAQMQHHPLLRTVQFSCRFRLWDSSFAHLPYVCILVLN